MTFATDEPRDSALQSEEAAEAALKEARWYAVQVASGCEKRVKTNLEQRIQTFDVADKIIQVEIPHTPAVKIRKDGSRQHTEEKVFPGYVLVRMIMNDDTWQVVRNVAAAKVVDTLSQYLWALQKWNVSSNKLANRSQLSKLTWRLVIR
jgi:transcription termination/antitermination protein NusG